MSKIKLLTIAVIGILAINMGVVGFLLLRKPPMPVEHMRRGNPDGPKKMIIEKLRFNNTQVSTYEQLIAEHRILIKELKDSISDTKTNLYQSLKMEAFDGKDSLINLLGVLQKQIESVHYEHFIKLKELCKPEQMEAFNTLTGDLAFYFTTEKKVLPPPPGN